MTSKIVLTTAENIAGRLDAKGRCCGRKPNQYKGGPHGRGEKRHRFCRRCNRAYDYDTGQQIENWAFKKCPGCERWIAGWSASACGECTVRNMRHE